MKILVTGGCGFIGSHFIRRLLMEGNNDKIKIINMDKLTYAGNPNNLKDVKSDKRYKFIKADICGRRAVEKCMKGTDIIVHFAAETHVDRSIIDAGSFVRTDVLGTCVLLESARKAGVEKFVHISTDEVYGSVEKGRFRENDAVMPNSPYAASKAGGELLARSYFVTHGLPVVIVRSSNNYGPFQHPEKFIPHSITNLLRGRNIRIYGNGSNIRDWLFVKDNCAALETVMKKGKPGESYNVGGGHEKTNIDAARKIADIMGMRDCIEFVRDRKGHDFRYALNWKKTAALGWKPETGFDSGLAGTVKWYRENEWWWKPLVS
ncbi:MAG: dTDP-glucose 4,6-dehydratase [Candidatus Aenigmarchaeota archaeon]|nr:dTDP-glucose 4,6-dehydratase [Candidatus Aenigmarchaeota archaeon]